MIESLSAKFSVCATKNFLLLCRPHRHCYRFAQGQTGLALALYRMLAVKTQLSTGVHS